MKYGYAAIIILIVVMIALTGCTQTSSEGNVTGNALSETSSERTINIDKLEIYHFHATNQCVSCRTLGAYAEETVNTYFSDELYNGVIVFGHVNVDNFENKELAAKYGATGSSLWLGTYEGEAFNAEENVNVWYKLRDKEEYIKYLKGVIEQKLAGN